MYGVILRLVKDDEISEEVLQDAFLKIWEKIDLYDETKGKLFTWMLNVTRNLAIDRTRSKEMNQRSKTENVDHLVHTLEKADHDVIRTEGIGLKEVLGQLTDEHRFVIEHLYLKGFTQSELAEEFNIPLGTIKTRTRLALVALRALLKEN